MGKFIAESDFYKKNFDGCISAYYLEEVKFCHYSFPINDSDKDYNHIALISNSYPLYSRNFPCLGGYQYGDIISPESTYANFTEETRSLKCPKIAWGFSSYLLYYIIPDNQTWPNNTIKLLYSDWNGDFKLAFSKEKLFTDYINYVSSDYIDSLKTLAHDGESEFEKQIKLLEFMIAESKQSWNDTQNELKKFLCTTVNSGKSLLLFKYVKKITEEYIMYIHNILDSLKNETKPTKPIGFITYQ